MTGSDGSVTVCGYSAIYNSRSRLLRTIGGNSFYEEIAPGAFDDTDFSDMLCNFDHVTMLCRAPTLRVRVDNIGLYYEYEHDPLDPDHVSVLRKIQRGDVTGCSFAFSPPLPGDEEVVMLPEGVPLRRVLRIRNVYDVGPVARPAYMQTGVYARSIDEYAAAGDDSVSSVPNVLPGLPSEASELAPEASGSEAEVHGIPPEVPEADTGSEAEDTGSEAEGPAHVPDGADTTAATEEQSKRGIDAEILAILVDMSREPYYNQLI